MRHGRLWPAVAGVLERLEQRLFLSGSGLGWDSSVWTLGLGVQAMGAGGALWMDLDVGDGRGMGSGPDFEIKQESAQGLMVQVRVPGAGLEAVEARGRRFARVVLPGTGFTGAIGRPQLPVIRRVLEVPAGARLSVEVTGQGRRVSLGSLGAFEGLLPEQPPAAKVAGAAGVSALVIDSGSYSADAFAPEGQVRVVEAGYFKGQRLAILEVAPILYNPMQKELLVYPELKVQVSYAGAAEADGLVTSQAAMGVSGGRLLVIAHDSLAGAQSLGAFVELKESQGWAVDLTSTATAGTFNQTIQSFIMDRYADPATRPTALLLVGDTGLVPQWQGKAGGLADTDLYYATMDGGDDWQPEFPVGRFSVTSVEQLDAVVDKTIAFQTASPAAWMYKAAFLAGRDFYTKTEGPHDYAIDNYLNDLGYSSDRLYVQRYSATTSQVVSALNDGRALTVYSGHGSPTGWLDGPAFDASNINALSNAGMYPFVASFACQTGKYGIDEALAETWLRAAEKGAVAVLAASADSYWTPDEIFEKKLFDAIYGEGQKVLGEAVLRAKQLYMEQEGIDPSKFTRLYFEMYNLLGDPTAQIPGDALSIVSSEALPSVFVNEAVQINLRVGGGMGPYTWSLVDGALPAGLALDASGLISGTPTNLGEARFTVQVSDALGMTDTEALTLAVGQRLAIVTEATLPGAAMNQPYSLTLAGEGGMGPYSWSLMENGQYVESSAAPGFVGGGVGQGWHADDESWVLELPWAFEFYGNSYTSVNVASNGFLDFTQADHSYLHSASALEASVRIAPLWTDLRTDRGEANIFVTQTAELVAIRWMGTDIDELAAVDFEAVLYRNGQIRFNYRLPIDGLSATIGVSGGDGIHSTLSVFDGSHPIPADTSLAFAMGQVLPGGMTLDPATGILSGTPSTSGTYRFTIRLSDWSAPPLSVEREFALTVERVAALSLSLPQTLSESAGRLAGVGRVSVSGVFATDLVVVLQSSDPTALMVPATVTIPAGQMSASFDLVAVDDSAYDGVQAVTVTAAAGGLADAAAGVLVKDDEVHHFDFAPVAGRQGMGVAFDVEITARDINGALIEEFAGPIELTASGDGGALGIVVTETGGANLSKAALPAPQWVKPVAAAGGTSKGLGVYHGYAALTAELNAAAAAHPEIARLYTLGTSTQGRELWALKITDRPDVQEDEPEFKYVSTLHGDEPVGTEMVLYLIDRLLNGYGSDPRISSLVDSTELWLVPLANPDGLEWGTRGTAGGFDLNRSFPEGAPPANLGTIFDGSPMSLDGRPKEVAALMQWSAANSFTLSAGIHTGSLVVNYPFDNDGRGSVFSPTPDEGLFRYIAEVYSWHNPPMWNSASFANGVTNGAEWYAVSGGMQDWNYRYLGTNEVTLELSVNKKPAATLLPTLWSQNAESMLAFMETVHIGVRGVVTDARTGQPVWAQITVAGNSQRVFTDPDVGDFHRMLLPGTYDLTIAAPGYAPRTVRGVTVDESGASRVDVALVPVTGLAMSGGVWRGQIALEGTDTNVTLMASDAAGHVGRSNSFEVVNELRATTDALLPAGAEGRGYELALEGAGGMGPYAWSVVSTGDYVPSSPAAEWIGGGVGRGWNIDDDTFTLSLPWAFSFYGTSYTSVNVSSNGFLDFASMANDFADTHKGLKQNVRVAPLWDDLLIDAGRGDDVFVTQTSEYVAVRWAAHVLETDAAVNFEAVLYRSGEIRFNYQAMSGVAPTVGVSRGDGTHFTFVYPLEQNAINEATSVLLSFRSMLPEGLTLSGNTISGTPTAAGDYTFTLELSDSSSPANAVRKDFALRVNPRSPAPGRPVLLGVSDTGISDSDGVTRLNNAGLAGRLEFLVPDTIPGAVVGLYWGQTLLGSAVAGGTSTIVVSNGDVALPDGPVAITARQEGAVDGPSQDSAGAVIVIDMAAPVVSVDRLVSGDLTPALGGLVDDPEAVVSVSVLGRVYEAFNNWDGTWTLWDDVIAEFAEAGVYGVIATAMDAAGNSAMDSTSDELTVGLMPTIYGSGEAEHYEVRVDGWGMMLEVYDASSAATIASYPLRQVWSVAFALQGGDDRLSIDWNNGGPIPIGGISVSGGEGNDALEVRGDGGLAGAYRPGGVGGGSVEVGGRAVSLAETEGVDAAGFGAFTLVTPGASDQVNVSCSETGLAISGASDGLPMALKLAAGTPLTLDLAANDGGGGDDGVTVSGLGVMGMLTLLAGRGGNALSIREATGGLDARFDGGGTLDVTLNSATVSVASSQSYSGLSLEANGRLDVLSDGERVLRLGRLAIDAANGGRLDLANNALIVQAEAGGGAADAEAVFAMLASGRAGGSWGGNGIASTAAAGERGLALLLNDRGHGLVYYSSFAGQAVDSNSILVRYTLNGDADLNGVIDASDYFRLNRGKEKALAGYGNGDFSYDRQITLEDYGLIDRAYLQQTMLSKRAASSSAVVGTRAGGKGSGAKVARPAQSPGIKKVLRGKVARRGGLKR